VKTEGESGAGTGGDGAPSKRAPSSKFRGVSKRGKKWQAQITINVSLSLKMLHTQTWW
jgi:hypothetical protein